MASTGEVWKLGHRPALDGVRGIAVLLVVAAHTGYLPEPAGAVGVAVFFVLSGFLVTRVILEAQARGDWSMWSFLGNRAARLYPALAVMVVGISALWITLGRPVPEILGLAAVALLYLQNFTGGVLGWTPFDHTWSLAVEEQFYLLLPLALPFVLRRRHPAAWLLVAAVASACLRVALAPSGWSYMSLPTNAAGLLVGCALALVVDRLRSAHSRVVVPMALGALGVVVTLIPVMPAPAFTAPLVAVPAAVVLTWGALAGHRLLELGFMRFAGRISYALYLWHFPLLAITDTQFTRRPALPLVAAALVLAVVSTLLVEEPIRRAWRSRRYATPVTRRRYSNDTIPAVAVPHEEVNSPA